MHVIVDGSPRVILRVLMGRLKQFDERIQLTLIDATTGRIDALFDDGEYRLNFIRTAIEAEIEKRRQSGPGQKQAGRQNVTR